MNKKVLVIGGGVAGLQASIELAELGFEVYLVEKKPYLGGNALNLYEYFPTKDCSFCLASPQFLKGIRKCFYRLSLSEIKNLDILTNTSLAEVKGEKGNFLVRLIKHPRYIDINKCTLCKACIEVCKSGAIYFDYRTLPQVCTIDINKCSHCKACVEVCKQGAINLEQSEEEVELNVGAIIVATGFEEWKPYEIKQYGYGVYKNVITQSELAEILYKDKDIEKLKDIEKVVFILCVGSRDSYHEYCSKICCTYAIKHARALKKLGKEVIICYMDIRTVGEYEEWYLRAREEGVEFLRGKPGEVIQREDKKLLVSVEDTLCNEVKLIECDLVVLTPALIPSKGTEEIAKLLGLNKDEYGFIITENGGKARAGVYVCGCASGIKDVPESITQASQVAINVMEDLR